MKYSHHAGERKGVHQHFLYHTSPKYTIIDFSAYAYYTVEVGEGEAES